MSISLGNGEVVKIYKGNSSYKVMTAVIDLSNSNPATCVSYADDAVNMTAGSSAWDEFFGHYPCILNNGVEVGKLNPSNFNLYENGDAAPVTKLGNDVMIAFPRLGVRITTENNKIIISMTKAPNNPGFKYYAHSRGDVSTDVFYLGTYKGYVSGDKLYSAPYRYPTTDQTIGTFRTQAHNRGSGYEQSGFYQLVFRQCMYILKYKNLNSQNAVGWGLVGGTGVDMTGATSTKGMDYGSTTTKTLPVKLFGIEDFWGNVWEWVDGLVTDANRNILTNTTNFQDDGKGTGYMSNSSGLSSDAYGYMSKPQGTTEKGFVLKEGNGSETTYFSDFADLFASCVANFGGAWDNASYAGVFRLNIDHAATATTNSTSSRLMYLPTIGSNFKDKEGEIQKVYLGENLVYESFQSPLVLYDAGNEYVGKTGGWIGGKPVYDAGFPPSGTFTKEATDLRVTYRNAWCGVTVKAIDLTKYTKLHGTLSGSNRKNGYIKVCRKTEDGKYEQVEKYDKHLSGSARETLTLDITNLTGKYYPSFGGSYNYNPTGDVYLYKMWLE